MIKILTIDHVVLRTTQLSAMLNFYCQILGCVEERRLDALGLVQLRAGDALIDLVDCAGELGRQGGVAPRQNGRNMDHVCLRIAAVDEHGLCAYLEHNGIKLQEISERYGATGFGRSLYIADPEGNVVELKLENRNQGFKDIG
ncbi:MAG: VOC family protein [Gammaproteobacteria bacterium]|nr:VOC family protein [Gammaproteobacteria bacterium]